MLVDIIRTHPSLSPITIELLEKWRIIANKLMFAIIMNDAHGYHLG